MEISHYEILGVPHDAEAVQIAAAYKRLMRKFHPDLNQDDQDAHEQAILINAAFKVLSDPELRKEYDNRLEMEAQRSSGSNSLNPTNETPGNQNGDASSQQPSNGPGPNSNQSKNAGERQQSRPNTFNAKRGKSRKAYVKKSQPSPVLVKLGIVLGALTAIPIGLFLVWVISGFDPLGIFRNAQSVAQTDPAENGKEDSQDRDKPQKERKQKGEKDYEKKHGDSKSATDTDVSEKEDAGSKNHFNNLNQIPDDDLEKNGPKSTDPGGQVANKSEDAAAKLEKSTSAANSESKDVREGIPPVESVNKAKKEISQVFRSRYTDATNESGVEKYKQLLAISQSVAELIDDEIDSVKIFALFEVAIDIGRQSLFANETLKLVDDFEARYSIDGSQMRLELLRYWQNQIQETLVDSNDKKMASSRLAIAGTPSIEKASNDRNWDMASRIAIVIQKLYQGADDDSGQARFALLASKFNYLSQKQVKVQLLVGELEKDSDQPSVNYIVGSYFGFDLGDWEAGLPYLAKCDNPELAACAREDLAGNLKRADVGDMWWKLLSSVDLEEYATQIASRAASHYRIALLETTGIRYEIMKSRILEAAKLKIYKARSPGLPASHEHGSDNIEIVRAVFGEGIYAGRCEAQIRRFIKDENRVITISTPGLEMKNPRGGFRSLLVIDYKVDHKPYQLKLKNGSKVNLLYKLITNAAESLSPIDVISIGDSGN